MTNETLLQFEEKVKLLIAHVSLLKKENQILKNQDYEKTGIGNVLNQSKIKEKLNQMIGTVDSELKKLKNLTP
mgnify:CR=1 FL=1|jgi:hypothetical protein